MKTRNFDSNALIVDIFDYMFAEWLCRRGFYSKFVANLSSEEGGLTTPRAAIRGLIVHLSDESCLSFSDAVLSAFNFESTPEGFTFWLNVSREWKNFVESLPHFI